MVPAEEDLLIDFALIPNLLEKIEIEVELLKFLVTKCCCTF